MDTRAPAASASREIKPTKEAVRAWLQGRREARQAPPGPEAVRLALDWHWEGRRPPAPIPG